MSDLDKLKSKLEIIMEKKHGRLRNVHLIKIGPKSLRHTRQVIFKDKECNLGPVTGYLS